MHADELRDATRERLLAEIGTLRHQYDISNQAQLVGRIRELEMALLQSRDYSMGLSAEVGEMRAANAVLAKKIAQQKATLDRTFASRTWRLGYLLLTPLRVAKRVVKAL
jgi:hypothetical protein